MDCSARAGLRRLLAICATLLIVVGGAMTGNASARTVAGDARLVVKLMSNAGTSINQINARYGTRTVAVLPWHTRTYLLHTAPGSNPDELARQIELHPGVLFAEPNYVAEAPLPSPSSIKAWGGTDVAPLHSQYALTAVALPTGPGSATGAGAVVAVIDTGVQLDHPELESRLTTARFDFVDGDATPEDELNGVDDDGNGVVDEVAGHGTHVAGVIRLIAPGARIMPLRVLDSDGQGETFAVAAAIQFAAVNGADVINLSLGTAQRSDLLSDVIKQVSRRGVLVVVAAGNENQRELPYPAADSCALSVTAVGPDGLKASFANFGSEIDVAAPGEAIYSTYPPSGYAWWSGTSMAAPFVAGQAALIHGLAPRATVRELASLIVGSARPIDALNPGYERALGNGVPDIAASLRAASAGQLRRADHYMSGGCSD